MMIPADFLLGDGVMQAPFLGVNSYIADTPRVPIFTGATRSQSPNLVFQAPQLANRSQTRKAP